MFAKKNQMRIKDFKADNLTSDQKNHLLGSLLKSVSKNNKKISSQTVMLYPVAFNTTFEDKKGKILADITSESKPNGKWEVWGRNVLKD